MGAVRQSGSGARYLARDDAYDPAPLRIAHACAALERRAIRCSLGLVFDKLSDLDEVDRGLDAV